MNLKNIIEDNVVFINYWEHTIFNNYYCSNPASKGTIGEKIISEILKQNGFNVKPRENTGHDRIINNIKTEIKFALSTKGCDDFEAIFNHIGFEKDWDEIIFAMINGCGEIKILKCDKQNFCKSLLSRQQGGKSGNNDDFMINSINSKKLFENPTNYNCKIIVNDVIKDFWR